jgi:hypothetical protein
MRTTEPNAWWFAGIKRHRETHRAHGAEPDSGA